MGLFDSVKEAMATNRLTNPQLKHRGSVSGDRVEDFWFDLEQTYDSLCRVDLTRGYYLSDVSKLLVQMRRYEILYTACIGWGCDAATTVGDRLKFGIDRSSPSFDEATGIDGLTQELLAKAHKEAGSQLTEDYRGVASRRVRLARY